MMDDIPEARRKLALSKPKSKTVSRRPRALIFAGVLSVGAILGLAVLAMVRFQLPQTATVPIATPTPSTPELDNVLGHLEYEQASASALQSITTDGRIRLRQAAAASFLQMQAAARASGVSLVPISGFRTIEEQNHLFFEVKQQRNQEARERAEVSAPPGYSEHHTGYAIDMGDGKVPAANLSASFEKTAAFAWLQANAAKFSFEMSFPPNNPQGINYEPWHWRFAGDRHSLETFYKAKQLQKR